MDDIQAGEHPPMNPAEEPAGEALPEAFHEAAEPAAFWVRVGAAFLDGLAMLAALLVVSLLATMALGQRESAVRLIQAAAVVLGGLYYTLLVGWTGQTLGKMAAGIRVVCLDGAAVGMGRSFARWLAYSAASLAGLLLFSVASALGVPPAAAGVLGLAFSCGAFVAAAFGPKRAAHDFLAGTRVEYLPGVGAGRRAAMAALGVLFLLCAAALGFVVSKGVPEQAGAEARMRLEGENAANLNALRVVVARYKDEKGSLPESLEALKQLQDFTVLPTLSLPEHAPSSESVPYQKAAVYGKIDGRQIRDTGRWGYAADSKDSAFGTVFIDCTHTDSQGAYWFQY